MVSPGRVGAARALLAVEEGAFSDEALEKHLADQKDRDLGWFLALGVLRRRAEVDAALRPFLKHPLASLDAPVRAVLRLGTFEKLFARTSAHAVVHQAVEVARRVGAGRASGLVNAVLRRVRAPESMQRHERLNLPPWLMARWDARYGADAVDHWAAAAAEPPPLVVVATDPALLEAWSAAGLTVRPARAGDATPDGVWRIDGHRGPVTGLPGWESGRLWVQDAAAVAVADLCEPGPGARILDACAAPGGKTLRLAAAGATVLAVDRSDDRLPRVRENLARTGMKAEVRRHDWERGPLAAGLFDVVLVDAPCTALGTLRRSPEVKWRRQLPDLGAAAARQRAILDGVVASVRPGGRLIYAVCSPEPEEGPVVVDGFLAEHTDFRLDRTWSSAPPVDDEDAHQAFCLVRVPR